MEIGKGRPAVVAGLATALGFSAVLAATPLTALATDAAAGSAIVDAQSAPAADERAVAPASSGATFMVTEEPSADAPAEETPVVGEPVVEEPVEGDATVPQDPVTDEVAEGDAADEGGATDGGSTAGDDADDAIVPSEGEDLEDEKGEEDVTEGESDDAAEDAEDVEDAEDAGEAEAAEGAADAEATEGKGGELLATEDELTDSADVLASNVNTWVKDEDGAYQWYDASGTLKEGGWVVTDKNIDNTVGELQRYWVDPLTGTLAIGRLVDPVEGAGYWAYSTLQGWVVRGKYKDSETGYVYFADNDGRLVNTGWMVTDAYGDGLQRYWIDEETHAAMPGYSSDGWDHYTTEYGYVVRGKHFVSEPDRDLVYVANNDGLLAGPGWVVSDAYGDGLQRYWIDDEAHAAVVGYSSEGWDHYTTDKGYVLRGGIVDSEGNKRWADNDGRLVQGWLVTGFFTNGNLERYWQEGGKFATNKFIDAGNGWWAYATSTGAVLRGTGVADNGKVYLADNDGRLVSGSGWLVTDKYGYGLQRYYLEAEPGTGYSHVKTGFFQANAAGFGEAWFYGDVTRGYVARGKLSTPNGVLIANNDGVLLESMRDVRPGMYVTGDFDGGTLRRYYLVEVDGHLFAKTGVFTIGKDHYFGFLDEGYLAVGRVRYGSGLIVATHDGVLLWKDSEGWLVTSEFDGAPQRYYFINLGDGVMGARIGLFTVGDAQYYGREDTGYVVRGTYTAPDGRVYYADEDGKLSYAFLTAAGWSAWDRIKGLYSWTQYLLVVDTDANRTVVFQGGYIAAKGCYGNWTPLYDWSCSTGNRIYNGGQGTLRGTFTIAGDDADYNWSAGYYTPGGYRTEYWVPNDVKYFTGFVCNLGFHSTIGYQGGYSDPGQLGGNITHGCIRLLEANAKWIFDNALPGTKVVVF